MNPYVDLSYNEGGKTEFSIHGLNPQTLRDLMIAADLLRYMLKGKLALPSFRGNNLLDKPEKRVESLNKIIWEAKKALVSHAI